MKTITRIALAGAVLLMAACHNNKGAKTPPAQNQEQPAPVQGPPP